MTWVYEIPGASGLLFTRVMTDWLLCITRLSLGFKGPKSNWCIIVLPYPPGLSLTWSKWLLPLPIGLYLLLSALIFYTECATLESLHLLDCFLCLLMGRDFICFFCSVQHQAGLPFVRDLFPPLGLLQPRIAHVAVVGVQTASLLFLNLNLNFKF